MAARRNKSQAKRNTGTRTGMPGWAWLAIGLALGAAAIVVVPRVMDSSPADFFRPTPNPDAQPAAVDEENGEPLVPDDVAPEKPAATPATDTPKERDYDFYTLLPGKEVPMSDAELAASERAESQRTEQAAADTTTPATAPLPKPIDEASAAPSEATPPAATAGTPAAPAPTPREDARARYLLQAGAFEASGQAEELKAKIALLGLSARVESAKIGAKTVFRVRMGPYGSAGELADAKRKLEASGLQAMPIRLQ
ncbi:MAG TPA: SPOR domain-containing protein [Lysobacter sp.]|nr:SPOR domain-containing protein [Lysobacter sp.]